MASAGRSIGRLFIAEPNVPNLGNQVKSATVADSEPDVSAPSMLDLQRAEWQQPVRGRFGRGFEGSAVPAPDLMGTMGPDTSPDRTHAFAALAARDRAAQLLRRLAARGWQGFPAPSGF